MGIGLAGLCVRAVVYLSKDDVVRSSVLSFLMEEKLSGAKSLISLRRFFNRQRNDRLDENNILKIS